MVESNWGSWFIQDEVEDSVPDDVSIWYLGCQGFILRSRTTTLYIDPYFGNGDPPYLIRMIPVPMDPEDVTMCDGILITHEHRDHMHPPSFEPMLEQRPTVVGPEVAINDPDYDGELPPDELTQTVEPGDRFEVGDFDVHVRTANDPQSRGPISYVIQHESGTFFHPGDSRPTDDFHAIGEEFDIDVSPLAFGTSRLVYFLEHGRRIPLDWYNDGDQLIELANALQVDRLLPTHHDMWKGATADPAVLYQHARTYDYPRSVEVIEIGDRVSLGTPGVKRLRAIDDGAGMERSVIGAPPDPDNN